jgi:hypothetical protein
MGMARDDFFRVDAVTVFEIENNDTADPVCRRELTASSIRVGGWRGVITRTCQVLGAGAGSRGAGLGSGTQAAQVVTSLAGTDSIVVIVHDIGLVAVDCAGAADLAEPGAHGVALSRINR